MAACPDAFVRLRTERIQRIQHVDWSFEAKLLHNFHRLVEVSLDLDDFGSVNYGLG